jgi:hypothetical protein
MASSFLFCRAELFADCLALKASRSSSAIFASFDFLASVAFAFASFFSASGLLLVAFRLLAKLVAAALAN